MTDTNGQPPERPQRPSRLEAEVAEILARSEQPASFTEHVRRKAEASAPRRPTVPVLPDWRHLGAGSFLLGAIAFAVLGAALNGVSPLLGTLFGLVSVVSLAMVWFRRPPPSINDTKTWRGRDLGPPAGTPPWVENIRDRMRKPPR
jgi:hypothetical protein